MFMLLCMTVGRSYLPHRHSTTVKKQLGRSQLHELR